MERGRREGGRKIEHVKGKRKKEWEGNWRRILEDRLKQ